jgi:hypothetical protein
LPTAHFQQSQIRDINGEKKLYRTEGWMGGSPIVFVTKAPAVDDRRPPLPSMASIPRRPLPSSAAMPSPSRQALPASQRNKSRRSTFLLSSSGLEFKVPCPSRPKFRSFGVPPSQVDKMRP